MYRDTKHAVRNLSKSPGFTAIVLSTLALGVGANTAIFSIAHSVLLRPLPFASPERLVSLWEHEPDDAGVPRRFRVTAGNYFDWKSQAEVFDEMALFGAAGFNWTGDGEPEQLLGARVSAGYFNVLGIEPLLGRTFVPEETEPGRHRVLLLSHGLWQRRFGSSRDVVGRSLRLDGEPYEIVGVMPEGVYPTWPQATGRLPLLPLYQQIWVPMALSPERRQDRSSHVFGVLARLDEGITLEAARAEMDTIARRLEQAYPRENAGEGILVVPYLDEVVGGARPALLVLLGAVGLVLLVACANIASLLLARSEARRSEMALRAALGARRVDLARPFVCESLVLGLAGGALGVALARAGLNLLIGLSPAEVPRLSESVLDLPVLGFALALSLGTGLLFGLAPAIQMSSPRIHLRLKERFGRLGTRRALVVSEIALAVVLVVSASLLLQSFFRLRNLDPGFSPENVLVAELNLPSSKYQDFQSISGFQRAVLERLEALPGVRARGLAYDHPLSSNWIDAFRIQGRPTDSAERESFSAALRIVSPDYFRTMGIEVRAGRPFEDLDDAVHPGASIVNESFVRRYFPDGVAIGESLLAGTPSGYWGDALPKSFEIVGVVEDVRFLGPAEPAEPAFYLPAAQFPVQEMMVAVRTAGDPVALLPALRREIRAVDPDVPVSGVRTMDRLLSAALAQPRFLAVVLGFFGATSLALAALGIYGLLSSAVAQRTSEIGIRMALGARAADLVAMIVSQGVRLAAAGIAAGVLAAIASSRVLRGLLFEVSTTDLRTFVLVPAFLLGVALVASYLPARRASRLQPLRALRLE